MPQSISEECICFNFPLSLHSIAAHLLDAINPMTFPNIHGASLAMRKHNSGLCCMLRDAAKGYVCMTQLLFIRKTRIPVHDAADEFLVKTQTKFTCSLTMAGCTPKKGSVAEPGLAGQIPGRGASTWAPVSVCQYVSTMGHLSPPTTYTMQHSLLCLLACSFACLLAGLLACLLACSKTYCALYT